MNDITAEELRERIAKGEKINIIDVREPYEYEEYNIGAMLIPLGDLQSKIDELEAWMEEEVVVHCKSGARSAAAKAYMVKYGFKNVRSLLGGVISYQSLEV